MHKKRPLSLKKIAHVYDTYDDEKIWIVKTVDGKKKELPKTIIDKHKLLTEETTWTFRKTGIKARYKVGEEFLFVYWQGFKQPSREPIDFEPTILDDSDYE